jgi:hypothetical protein
MHGMLSRLETVRRSCVNFVARRLKIFKAESGKQCFMSRCFHDRNKTSSRYSQHCSLQSPQTLYDH